MIRWLIYETLWIHDLIQAYSWIPTIVWGSVSLVSFVLFIYHLMNYHDLEFFLENVDILGDFSMNLYKFSTLVVSIIPLFAVLTIIWSAFEGFDSRKFLKRFGCY